MDWQHLGIIEILKWNNFFFKFSMDWAWATVRCMSHMQLYVGGTTTEVLVTVVVQNWRKLRTVLHTVRNYWKNCIRVWHIYHSYVFLCFSSEKERNIWNPLCCLNTECRLQRHLCWRTATCSMYNYVVWVCTNTTDLSCYLFIINNVIHYMKENNSAL